MKSLRGLRPLMCHDGESLPGTAERPIRSLRGECAPGPGISLRAAATALSFLGGAAVSSMPPALALKAPSLGKPELADGWMNEVGGASGSMGR